MDKKNKIEEGFWGNLTPSMELALNQLKDQMKAMIYMHGDTIKFIIDDDIYCLQFLRARKFDVKNAMIMITKYCKWSHDNDIGNILKFRFPEIEECQKYYPRGYHKTDRMVLNINREDQFILKGLVLWI